MRRMNTARYLSLYCLLLGTTTTLAANRASPCVSGNLYLLVENVMTCNYDNLLTAFEDWYQDPLNAPPKNACAGVSAEAALWQLLQVSSASAAQTKVNTICNGANTNYNKDLMTLDQVAKSSGLDQEANALFLKNFYLGRTDWNEQYETKYGSTPTGINDTHVVRDEAQVLDVIYYGTARTGKFAFPDTLPQFSNCQTTSVYCCWAADRQPNDGNGNCQYPTDTECVDADPADNTNLCLVQHSAGSSSTTWKSSTGTFLFPGDDDEGEGPSHCHGFVWDEYDQNAPSYVYRGNNMFYMTMYDHLYRRGYVRNVPGAPQCACAEQMPVVSRSDCTEMSVIQSFKFVYENSAWTAEVLKVDIEYNACKGYDRTGKEMNNDLWAHYNKLFQEGRVSAAKFQTFSQHVLIQDLCRLYEKNSMAKQGFKVGYKADANVWYQVAGREAAAMPTNFGSTLFGLLFDASKNKIVRRTCPGCLPTHQNIYYKRLTSVPSDMNLLKALLSQHEAIDGQEFGTDFELYDNYNKAINGENAWPCNYKNEAGFPGGCGPKLDGMYEDQSSHFDWGSGRGDVAFYVETSALAKSVVKRPSVHIGWKYAWQTAGGAFAVKNTIYMTAVGADMGNKYDSFDYSATSATGDVTVTVQVVSLTADQDWTKAGLDIRATNDPGSPHFAVILTKIHGIYAEWRTQANGYSNDNGTYEDNTQYTNLFLRIKKVGSTFTGSYSTNNAASWTSLLDSPVTISGFPSTFYVGLAMTAQWSSTPPEAIFTSYTTK